MNDEWIESYNIIVRSALKRFLECIQHDTSEWFCVINGDSNHPYYLCMMLGMRFDDTMMLLQSSDLTHSRKSESVKTDAWETFL